MIILILTFLFCMGPYTVVSTLVVFNLTVPTPVFIISGIIFTSNSAINPFLYSLVRPKLKATVLGWCKC